MVEKKPKLEVKFSKTAQLQFMGMTPDQQAKVLEAMDRIAEDPSPTAPNRMTAEEYLATLPPEQAEAMRARLRAAMADDPEPEVTQ